MAKRCLCVLLAALTVLSLCVPAFATEAPVEATEEPIMATEVPVEATEAPAEATEAPIEATEAPVEATEAPIEATEEPVEATEPPVEVTEAPVEATEAPAEATEVPVEATEAPVEATEAPIEATEAPVEVTETPVEATEAPVKATEAPVEVTETPVEATEAPVKATEAPVEATEAPVEVTEAPIEATEAPVEATEAPVEATEEPVEATEEPVEAVEATVEVAEDIPEPAPETSGKCGDALTWEVSGGVLTISGTGVMDDYSTDSPPWSDVKDTITGIVIQSGVTSIGEYAFSGISLTEVTVPESVTSIGVFALDCQGIQKVTILNPECTLSSGSIMLREEPGPTVCGRDESTAEKYAGVYGLSFAQVGPDAPSVKSVKNVLGGVKITWDKVKGAARYRVYYRDEYDYYSDTWTEAGVSAGASYTWSGAENGGCYSFVVQPLTAGGYALTGRKQAGESIVYHPAPDNIKVSFAADKGLKITWDGVSGIWRYQVYYKTGSTGGWKKLGESQSYNQYTWEGPKSNTQYAFTVCCLDSSGEPVSAYDDTGVSIKYLAPPTVSTKMVASGVKVSWKKVTGAAAYRVYYRSYESAKWTNAGSTTGSSYTIKSSKLKNGTSYQFTVQCVASKTSKKPASPYDSGGALVRCYATPKVTMVKNMAGGVYVSWNKGTADYCRLFYKTGSGGWHSCGDYWETNTTVTGLKSGKKYTFTVRVVSGDGKTYMSGYDAKGKSVTYIAQPEVKSVSNTAKGVKITWGKVSGAAKYRVFYKSVSGKWKKAGDTSSASFVWTKAKDGTGYYFTVQCLSKDGKSYTSTYNQMGKYFEYHAAPKITKVANTAQGVQVTWESAKGVSWYALFCKEEGSDKWERVKGQKGSSKTGEDNDFSVNSLIVTGLKSGKKYTFTVRSLDNTHSAPRPYLSSYDPVGKSVSYVAAPQITSIARTSSGVKITWSKSAGAYKYRVFYKVNSSGKWKRLTDTKKTTYTLKGTKNDATYAFTIRCLGKDGKKYVSSYDPAGTGIGLPIDKLSGSHNSQYFKRYMTDEEFRAAYAKAQQIVAPLVGMSRKDQLFNLMAALRAMLDSGEVVYVSGGPHYNDPYGYLVAGGASCAGCVRATGLCLSMLGIDYEHVNENQWSHQWARVKVGKEYWICDAYGYYCGPEPGEYMHPMVF